MAAQHRPTAPLDVDIWRRQLRERVPLQPAPRESDDDDLGDGAADVTGPAPAPAARVNPYSVKFRCLEDRLLERLAELGLRAYREGEDGAALRIPTAKKQRARWLPVDSEACADLLFALAFELGGREPPSVFAVENTQRVLRGQAQLRPQRPGRPRAHAE
jgi:hypothetical protein